MRDLLSTYGFRGGVEPMVGLAVQLSGGLSIDAVSRENHQCQRQSPDSSPEGNIYSDRRS